MTELMVLVVNGTVIMKSEENQTLAINFWMGWYAQAIWFPNPFVYVKWFFDWKWLSSGF